jgi:dipeptidyl aminopeptidase/acylaminoacyl peptidase
VFEKFNRLAGLTICIISGAIWAQGSAADGERLYAYQGLSWFEDALARVTISGDGEWALFARHGGTLELVSLITRKPDPARLKAGMDIVRDAVFCGRGLLRWGKNRSDQGWFREVGNGFEKTPLDPDVVPVCSADGKQLAYFRGGAKDGDLFIGDWKERKPAAMKGITTAAVFSPDGESVFALAFQPSGGTSLLKINARTGGVAVLAQNLDAPPRVHQIACSPDGKRLYLSLASKKAPTNAERQKPEAQRWLQIYELDLVSRKLKEVTHSEADKLAPTVVSRQVYWAQNIFHDSVAILPIGGGSAREVLRHAELPTWSRDGRRLGFTFGQWRLADWGLSLDAGVVSMDAEGNPSSDRTVLVAGNHEDFTPEWSPDGTWIAFHSHRAPKPVASYNATGATDDVWLRRAADRKAREIRLTDFGWETGSPSWSRDGRRLVFSSWDRKGAPRIYRMWSITIDPKSGQPIKHEQLPLPKDMRSPEWPVWSPVDDTLAVEDEDARPGVRTIWTMTPDGKQVERVVTYKSPTFSGLDWTPDGKTIVYSALDDRGMQIAAVDRSGGVPKTLTREGGGNFFHPRVSPDGRWIACTRLETGQEIWRKELD